MGKIAIIADDLTGASDTGIQFCKYGLKTLVIVDYQNIDYEDRERDVWAINADTRSLSAEEAYNRTYTIARKLIEKNFQYIYKKIDSTLRGHPGAELEGVMDALEAELALVVPAFPANGRLIVNGYLVVSSPTVQGPAQEGYGKEIAHEGSCYVPGLLQGELRRQVGSVGIETIRKGEEDIAKAIISLHNEGKQVLVLDAATEEDLAKIAASCNLLPKKVVLAGAAGLAAHLPATWDLTPSLSQITPQEGIILLVAGTRNPVTRVQVEEVLRVTRTPLVEVSVEAIKGGDRDDEIRRVIERVENHFNTLKAPYLIVIAVDSLFREEDGKSPFEGEKGSYAETIATVLGEITFRLVSGGRVRSLILTGGDTAIHICRALKVQGIDLVTELLPGIPLGKLLGGDAEGLPVVTKAGGFGPREAFVRVVEYLQKLS